MDADGGNRRRLPIAAGGKSSVSNYSPAWSPDGTRLAFTRSSSTATSDSGWRIDVYVVDLDGTNLRRLTSSGAAYGPTWSADGRRIAYLEVVGRAGSSESHRLHVVNADGSGDHTLLAASRATWAPGGHALIWPPTWSPDGRRIAFSRATRYRATDPPWTAFEIYVINPDGTGLRRLTRTTVPYNISPAWSPDGKQIVSLSLPNRVQVMNADGSRLRTVFRARPIGRFGGVSWQPVP